MSVVALAVMALPACPLACATQVRRPGLVLRAGSLLVRVHLVNGGDAGETRHRLASKIGSSYGAGHPPIVLRCIHDAAFGE